MTDLLLENTGTGYDLVIRDGDVVLTHNEGRPTEVSQRVIYRLSMWYGETPYDPAAGVPYPDLIFGENGTVPGAISLITQIALDTEGVDALADDPRFVLDSVLRKLDVSLPILIGEDTTTVSLEIVPL